MLSKDEILYWSKKYDLEEDLYNQGEEIELGNKFRKNGYVLKTDLEIPKMIFSKLFNLGEKELNRRKLERYENLHRFHFGWRKQLYLDDLKNNEFPL